MSPNRLQNSFPVNSRLQAAILQSTLEKAGIPARVTRDHARGYMSIVIPEEYAFDAANILKAISLSVGKAPIEPSRIW